MALQRADKRVIRWMCVVKAAEKFSSDELRKTRNRGTNDTITELQQRTLRCYGHGLQSDENDWAKMYGRGCNTRDKPKKPGDKFRKDCHT